jgi:hypothetical protein
MDFLDLGVHISQNAANNMSQIHPPEGFGTVGDAREVQ